MKKVFLIPLFLTLLLSFLIKTSTAFSATSVSGHKIVIDPGHGGSDAGSTECPGYSEKEANLDISQRLYTLLDNDGADVLLTRTGDDYLSNANRYNLANSFKGEALISIHLNGATDYSKNGTLGLYGKRNKDLAFTKTLHGYLATELGIDDLGVANFASGVLLKSDMPATIQETVFISNETECRLLTNDTGERQQEIARSLHDGLIDWFSQDHSNDNGGDGKGKKCETPPCKKNK